MVPPEMQDELAALSAENARLTGLLVAHGVAWRALVPAVPGPLPAQQPATSGASLAPSRLSPADTVALFGRLFSPRRRWQRTARPQPAAPGCAAAQAAHAAAAEPRRAVSGSNGS